MLQRAVYELREDRAVTQSWIDMVEPEMIDSLLRACSNRDCSPCIDGLFGRQRQLYKRVAQFDFVNHPKQHSALARKPYDEVVELSSQLASKIQAKTGLKVKPHEVLIDAPPVKLEVQFQLDVRRAMAILGRSAKCHLWSMHLQPSNSTTWSSESESSSIPDCETKSQVSILRNWYWSSQHWNTLLRKYPRSFGFIATCSALISSTMAPFEPRHSCEP